MLGILTSGWKLKRYSLMIAKLFPCFYFFESLDLAEASIGEYNRISTHFYSFKFAYALDLVSFFYSTDEVIELLTASP